MSAKRKKSVFRATVLSSVPDDAGVGVLGNDDGFAPSEERLAKLAELMKDKGCAAEPVGRNVTEEEMRIDRLFPATQERILSRDLLDPAPDKWNFFGRPSMEAYALIVQSIYKYGLWHPLTVWEREGGRYMILGGHTRNLAYGDLYELTKDEKYQSISCKVYKKGDIGEADARRIVILTNIAQRAQEKARIRIRCYAEMVRLEKEDAFYNAKRIDVGAAVARLFGVSRRQVFMYISLMRLIDPLLNEMDAGSITLSSAYALSRMPQELQQYIYEKGYFRELKPPIVKILKDAENRADIDQIFENLKVKNQDFQYKVAIPVEKPDGFDVFPLFVKDGESIALKEFLRRSLSGDAGQALSEETRSAIQKILDF